MPTSTKGPPAPSRGSGESATAARAAGPEPAVDPEEEDTASWVDDLLSQPALQPVRPPPLAATRGAEPSGRSRPAPAAREESAGAADLVLSDSDVLDGEEESQASSAGRAATGLDDGGNGDLADEIDALLSEVGDDEPEPGAVTAARNDADSEAADEAALAAEMANVPTWTVEPVGGRAAGVPDKKKGEAEQKPAKNEAAKAQPNQQRDANLGLSLVPEPEEFQDFGDFSELKGSADYGLLPEVEPADADGDLSALTLRPNSGKQARPPDADKGDGSDDDPEDLLSAVFGDGR